MRFQKILFVAAAMLIGAASAQETFTWPVPKPLDNAAPLYFRAFLSVRPPGSEGNKAEEEAFARFEKDGNYAASVFDPIVDRNGVSLEFLHEAAAIDRCDFGINYAQGLHAQFPELARARYLTRVGVLALRRKMAQGNESGALNVFIDLLRMAGHIQQNGTLIHAITDMGIVNSIFNQSKFLFADLPADDALYGRLIDALAAVTPVIANMDVPLNNEIQFFAPYAPPPGTAWSKEQLMTAFDAVFVVFSDTQQSPMVKPEVFARLASGTATPEEQEAVARVFHCKAQELTSPANLSVQLTRQMMGLVRGLKQAELFMKQPFPTSKPQLDAMDAAQASDTFLVHLVYPNLSMLELSNTAAETKLDLMRAAVMVLRWRLGQHSFPQSITQVPNVPADPFTIAMPFDYKPLDTAGFTLTSKGSEQRKPERVLTLTIEEGGKGEEGKR